MPPFSKAYRNGQRTRAESEESYKKHTGSKRAVEVSGEGMDRAYA